MKQEWKRQQIGFVLLIAVLFFCSCRPATSIRPATPQMPVKVDSETGLFSNAEKMFRSRSYNEALMLYDEYLDRFPYGTSVPAALMRKGAIYVALMDNERARRTYRMLIDRYPNSFLVPDAQVQILATFYNEGRYKDVIRQAEQVGKNVASREHALKLYMILADAYMGIDSPVNAVKFYAKAHELLRYPEKQKAISKLRQVIRELSTEDVIFLLDRLKEPVATGYLMYRLGLNHLNENRPGDAFRVFSEFVEKFSDHEMARDAKRLISEYDKRTPQRSRYAIGCLLPLTGSYQIYGNRALNGVELAMARFEASPEGRPDVNLIIKDTASDPDEAARAVQELSEQGVSVIIGPIITAETAAAEAQSRSIPIITLTQKEQITDIGDHVFRNFLTPRMQVRSIVSYAMEELGLKDFAILYPDEKYGETFMRLFWDEVIAYGGNMAGMESYRPNQTDFGDPIKKLAGHNRAAFEAIFIPDAPAKAGLIIPQLAFHDVNRVHLFGTNLWHSEKLIRMAGKDARGAVFPDVFFAKSNSQQVIEFVDDFQRTYETSPGFIEAIAYDTAAMVFQMMTQAEPRYGRTLKDALCQVRNFNGVTGLTSFDEHGEAHKKLYLLQVKGGRFVEVNSR